jgi:hypothetical protein
MKESRAALEKVLAFDDAEVKAATQSVDERRQLYELGLISREDFEQSERDLASAQAKLNETRRMISSHDETIAEFEAAGQLAKLPPLPSGGYHVTESLIRYNGAARWSLSNAPRIQRFFSERFGRALPVSAFGQTSAHDRLGFDHRDALDVAVHPDSSEGRGLMAYLRAASISFVAFRRAVAGSATGAHIHIGEPSLRAASVPRDVRR